MVAKAPAPAAMLGHLADAPDRGNDIPPIISGRRLDIYPASNGYDLVTELDHLALRAIEPNVFFNPRFLAPAMPRLEDREVRLAVMRDERDTRSRLRLLAPFSVERPMLRMGPPMIRIWSSPFGPLGTPLVDRDDPQAIMEDFLRMIATSEKALPKLLQFPDIRTQGVFAATLRGASEALNLPMIKVLEYERATLISDLDGDAYLRLSLSKNHYRELRRLERRLAETGEIVYDIAETPADTRLAIETFLSLEAGGWKGRAGTAMITDRFRAAFVREAIADLSERAMCRIHTLSIAGRPIASLVVLLESGIAYTWKTAFDETYSAYSPGTLLMMAVTRHHLEDLNVAMSDSCAVPDHPVMNRLWQERAPMATFVVGLEPGSDRLANAAARGLAREARMRNLMRQARRRLRRPFN
ncbi:GNAT family N-acetyltransferase [Aliihoeflea aestuarii]|jgi:CelD/BcsL family acetyltransferase involved in cellulose biosynthesis|uniref:GNAT family N-acetyltransferase n=1 Tax=Aliihoeflea aestuarii TaxID=453840 RepID=UPI0020941E4A|nr:GNAT family N-acetyltransferase [Aliihoeflea aestuarii]MCO6392558.1 GNAT family N-acetyltransferase [Aliihoeflea aestuarii]